jgi:hypothetical protein
VRCELNHYIRLRCKVVLAFEGFFEIAGTRHGAVEAFCLLDCYAVLIGSCLLTFRYRLLVQSSRDRWANPKRRSATTNQRCVTTQKREDAICFFRLPGTPFRYGTFQMSEPDTFLQWLQFHCWVCIPPTQCTCSAWAPDAHRLLPQTALTDWALKWRRNVLCFQCVHLNVRWIGLL